MQTDILVAYGKAIRRLRKIRNISQEDFADLCGLHRTYLSDIELGKRNVSLENIAKISDAFDMAISDFFIEVEKGDDLNEGF